MNQPTGMNHHEPNSTNHKQSMKHRDPPWVVPPMDRSQVARSPTLRRSARAARAAARPQAARGVLGASAVTEDPGPAEGLSRGLGADLFTELVAVN